MPEADHAAVVAVVPGRRARHSSVFALTVLRFRPGTFPCTSAPSRPTRVFAPLAIPRFPSQECPSRRARVAVLHCGTHLNGFSNTRVRGDVVARVPSSIASYGSCSGRSPDRDPSAIRAEVCAVGRRHGHIVCRALVPDGQSCVTRATLISMPLGHVPSAPSRRDSNRALRSRRTCAGGLSHRNP